MARYFVGGALTDPTDDVSLASYWNFTEKLKPVLSTGNGGTDIDLRPFSSERHDQKRTGSCVAQSVIKALENLERQYLCRKHELQPEELPINAHQDLSVLALYYLCREQMHPQRVSQDAGTYLFLACQCLKDFGVCEDKEWPFNPNNVLKSPPIMAMKNAYLHRISGYYRITETGHMRVERVIEALRGNHPVVYAADIGKNWYEYKAKQVIGVTDTVEGGHATHIVGWSNSDAVFIGENSWGKKWGDNGYYRLSPELIESDQSRDYWVITSHWS